MKVVQFLATLFIALGNLFSLYIFIVLVVSHFSAKAHDELVASIYRFMNVRGKYVKPEKDNNKR